LERAIEEVKRISRPPRREAIAHLASICAGDTTVGSFIAEAMDRVGCDGVITVRG